MELGFDLRAARTHQGLSQAELASSSGISLRQIKALEAGTSRNPHPHTVRRLRAALAAALPTPVHDWYDERVAFLQEFTASLKAVAPQVRYVELREEQTGRSTWTYYLSEIYDPQGLAIADPEPFEAISEILQERVSEYQHYAGREEDAPYLDLDAQDTVHPAEFGNAVTVPDWG